MAVPGFIETTLNEGEEICSDKVGQILDNLNAIKDVAGTSSDSVYCQPIDIVITGNEGCTSVENPLKRSDGLPSVEVDKKLITFTYSADVQLSFSDSDNINPYANTRIVVSCGDVDIYETGLNECSSGQPTSFVADCPRDDDLTFCLYVTTGGGTVTSIQATAQVCGAILCLGSRRRELDGFFDYRDFDGDCCYGRDAMNLAAQNAETLRSELATSCDQTAYCVKTGTSGTGSIALAQNIQRGAIYLVSGTIKVCAFSTIDFEPTLTVRPFVGCEGEQSNCIASSRTIPRREEGEPQGPTVCYTIPIIQCGFCEEGSTLFAGLTQVADCETSGQFGVSSSFVSATFEQSYCVWVFEKSSIDGLPDPATRSLDRCLSSDFTEELATSINTMHQFLCDRAPVNIQVLSPSIPNEYIVASGAPYDETFVLSQGDPLADPTVEKKWTMNFSFRPYYAGTLSQVVDRLGSFRVTVECGNNVLYDEYSSWIINARDGEGNGFINRYGPCLNFSDCFPCPANEDLTIRITSANGTALGVYSGSPLRIHMYCF